MEEVCRDPLLLAVPDGWDPDDLAAMPWAVETAASPAQGWALRTCRAAGFEPIVRYRSDDVLLHVRLVQAGRAAAFLPELVRRCGFPDVRLRPLPGPPQFRRIITAVRAGSSRDTPPCSGCGVGCVSPPPWVATGCCSPRVGRWCRGTSARIRRRCTA